MYPSPVRIPCLCLLAALLTPAPCAAPGGTSPAAGDAPRARWFKPGPGSPAFPSPGEAVGHFLATTPSARFHSAAGDLREERLDRSPAGVHVRLAMEHGGIPVLNGRLDLHLDHENRLYLAVDSLPDAPVSWNETFPDRRAALEMAWAGFDRHPEGFIPARVLPGALLSPVATESVRPVYWVEAGVPRAAWAIVLHRASPIARSIFVVGGSPLRTLAVLQGLQHVDGTGQVFLPNPVNALNNTALTPTSPPADFEGAYTSVTLQGLDAPVNGKYALVGPHVKISSLSNEPPGTAPPQESTPVFVYERTDPGFGAVMAYYWIDTCVRHIRALGFTGIMNYRIEVDAHGLSGADNSHYWPYGSGRGHIAFGDGGVPDAEDADVIVHELGHAIQDSTSPNYFLEYGQAGSIGEGFSDYWAFSNTYNHSVANSFDPFCIAEWDFATISFFDPPCLRRTDTGKVYPDDMTGQIHTDGEIWSCALVNLFLQLGKNVTDRIVLQSHYLMPYGPTFYGGATAMLEADAQLFGRQNQWAIYDEFVRRGVFVTGDLNVSRRTDAVDLLIFARYVAGDIGQGEGNFNAVILSADLDRNGTVNAADYVLLAQCFAN
ncbi:MAG: M36 family metallopeptidase [Acidobacteria bacterium]|nr:M36 family metallopeptidase [Acidobacteriota bacterium]